MERKKFESRRGARKRTVLTTALGLAGILVLSVGSAWGLSLPQGQNVYPGGNAPPTPVVTGSPATSRPIGTGGISAGGDTFSFSVETEQFGGPVDAYLGLFIPIGTGGVLVFVTEDGGFLPATEGIAPWRRSQTNISGEIFSDVPVSALPMGTYTFFLIVVPGNTPLSNLAEDFFLWTATMDVYRGGETGQAAAALLGSDASAGTAVLFALDRGYSLKQVVQGIFGGGLTHTGQLPGMEPAASKSSILREDGGISSGMKLRGFACSDPTNEELCAQEFDNALNGVLSNPNNPVGGLLVTVILGLADNGYSAEQITETILDVFTGADPSIRWTGGTISHMEGDLRVYTAPAALPAMILSGTPELDLDFPFKGVTQMAYSVSVQIPGVPPYASGTWSFTRGQYLHGSFGGQLVFGNYLEGIFEGTGPTISGDFHGYVQALVAREGIAGQVSIIDSVEYAAIVNGERKVLRFSKIGFRGGMIPFHLMNVKNGKPHILYEYTGPDVCSRIELVTLNVLSPALEGWFGGAGDGDFYCDENSKIQFSFW